MYTWKKLVYIAEIENGDLIEDGQSTNCRLKINIIIIEDMIGRLTNCSLQRTVHKHLLWGTGCKKVGLNICDLHKGTLKKNSPISQWELSLHDSMGPGWPIGFMAKKKKNVGL